MSLDDYILGYASGIGSVDVSCADGAPLLFDKYQFKHSRLFYPQQLEDKYAETADICTRLAFETKQCIQHHEFFTVIGGDHSSAIGTWSGVANGLRPKGALGLIWIDAHLDAHTPETSYTGNIHGMPLAALLGAGHSELTHIQDNLPKLLPENICIIGARSFEESERDFLHQQGVRIFYIDEVLTRGFDTVFQEALTLVKQHTCAYGLTIDPDAIDPQDAPGVSTPEKNGIPASDLRHVLKKYASVDRKNQRLCGIEITEFNPSNDIDQKTEHLIMELLELI